MFENLADIDDKLAGFAWLMTGRCYQQLGQNYNAKKACENANRTKQAGKLMEAIWF